VAQQAENVGQDVYRPLSLWAIAGLVVGGLYALMVAVTGLMSLVKSTPLPLGMWTFIFPVAGLVLSLLGHVQIQQSEGTRAGAKLATWGAGLSALFGCVYLAYVAATYFAVKTQAEKFTQEWFDLIKRGEIDTAFIYTQEPGQRQGVDPKNLSSMEARFNTAEGPRQGGPLSQFRKSQMVRFIELGGVETSTESRGVVDWNYELGGYKFKLSYRMTTPIGFSDVIIAVHGKESPHKEFTGRQWSVLMTECAMESGSPSPMGARALDLMQQARRFTDNWLRKLGTGNPDEAFLDTLPPADRETAHQRYQDGFLRPWLDAEAARDMYLPGYKAFREGGVIGTSRFWAPEAVRRSVPLEVKRLFARPQDFAQAFNPEDVRMPSVTQDKQFFRIAIDYQLGVPPANICEAVLTVETDIKELEENAPLAEWRLVGMDLIRARAMPMSGMRPPPGGAMPPGMGGPPAMPPGPR